MKLFTKEIIIALLIGGGVGWFAATRNFEPCWHGRKGDRLEKFSRELRLSPDQKDQVKQVLETKRSQIKALREEMRPRFEEIRLSSKNEIEKILTPDQIPAFHKMESAWQARREKWMKPRSDKMSPEL